MSRGDEDGEVPTRSALSGELVCAAAEGGPLGKAGREPGRVGFVGFVVSLEDFVAGHRESFGGKMGAARNRGTFEHLYKRGPNVS
jgi:hypothetical protein